MTVKSVLKFLANYSVSNHEIKKVLVKDIMTTKVFYVSPETLITDAAKIITEHNFAGLPVIDDSNHLIGIITEYDLITKTSSLNASFLQKILSDIYPDKSIDNVERRAISKLTVQDVMNPEPLTLKDSATFDEVIETFRAHHRVNPIPIINDENEVVGIISRFDVLRPLNILGYNKNNSD